MTRRLLNLTTALSLLLATALLTSCAHHPLSNGTGQQAAAGSEFPPRFGFYVEERRGGVVHEKHGFIDSAGKVVIPPTFGGADDFSEGLAHVWVGDRHAYIDAGGKVRFWLPEGCMAAESFSEGLALVCVGGDLNYEWIGGGNWGYVDRDGRFAVPARFRVPMASTDWIDLVSQFSEGLAAMPDAQGKFGFIDRTGRWAIPPRFDRVRLPFQHGLAKVEVGDEWGYIDHTGRSVWWSGPGKE
jgi:hypothetical protein